MKAILNVFVAALIIMLPVSVMAQQLPKEAVEEFSRIVHENMAGAMVGDNHTLTKEDVAKLEYPLLPFDLRSTIIIRGYLSGFAEHCGIDWSERSFRPLMNSLRAMTPKLNDYQLAFAGMLHGLSMENGVRARKDKPCMPEEKAKIETQMLK